MKEYLTAESVRAGHPDKLCDYISDKIVDACLYKDKSARVAVETMAARHRIVVAGEITCSARINIRDIVWEALSERGYNPMKYLVYVYVHHQSPDIAGGVDHSVESRNGDTSWYATLGAGDQGTVVGYACDENRVRIPTPLLYAHAICRRLDDVWKDSVIKGLGPDGKAQVTIEYEDGRPVGVKSIVVSVQHRKDKDPEQLRGEIISNVLWPVFEKLPFDDNTEILINPSGRFVEGGPDADTGLTGRKLMVDTYGGLTGHGGGAFSGKDPTKIDRSGAYMARYIAVNLVSAGFARRCQVSLSYAIGKADPTAVRVETFGTGVFPDEELGNIVREKFNLRPGAIIEKLKLKDTFFAKYACYGHFGQDFARWDSDDRWGELSEFRRNYAKDHK